MQGPRIEGNEGTKGRDEGRAVREGKREWETSMRPQRSLTAFADPSRQLATFQRRSHRGILLLKAHSHRFANQTRQPGGKKWRWIAGSRRNHGNPFFSWLRLAKDCAMPTTLNDSKELSAPGL